MVSAKRVSERVEPVKPKRKAKHSDSSSSDELGKTNASSSDEEAPLNVPKKLEKKTDVPEERKAQVINQFTFSVYINMI